MSEEYRRPVVVDLLKEKIDMIKMDEVRLIIVV